MKNKNDISAGILLTILGLAILASYLINLYSNYKSKDWISITAKVTAIELFSEGFYNTKTGRKTRDKYEVEISYFINDRFHKANIITAEKDMSEIVIKYNPNNINEIVITEKNIHGSWLMNLIGFILLVSGLFIIIKESIRIAILSTQKDN